MSFKKYIFLIFLMSLTFCSKDNTNEINQNIYLLQKKINKTSKDSMQFYLSKVKPLFESNKSTPDSLKAENYFLIGRYFEKFKNEDSASYYFNKVLKYSKDSINNKREIYRFLYIAENYYNKIDYLNGLNTIDRLDKLLKNKNDYNNLADIYNYKNRVYQRLQNFKKSLEFNKKTVAMFTLSYDTVNLINNLIHQAKIYRDLNSKKEAYRLLDSINKLEWSDFYLKFHFYNNYGIFKFYDAKFYESFKNYIKALNFIKNTPYTADFEKIGITYLNISEVLIILKKYNLAKVYIDSAKMYKKYFKKEYEIFFLQNKLGHSFFTNKNYELILQDFDELANTTNRIYEDKINYKFNELNEVLQKEKELLITNQETKINYLNEFCYKLNRRYFGNQLFDRVVIAVSNNNWQFNE